MRPMIIPTVNINGSSVSDLLDQNEKIYYALDAVLDAMANATPHGRDFQLADPDVGYTAARDAFNERRRMIADIKADFSLLLVKLSEQKK